MYETLVEQLLDESNATGIVAANALYTSKLLHEAAEVIRALEAGGEAPPVEPPHPPDPPSTGGLVFESLAAWAPTPGDLQLVLKGEVPPGEYSGFVGEVDFRVESYADAERAAHGIFYATIDDRNRDLIASVFLNGPPRRRITARHGIGIGAIAKSKDERVFVPDPSIWCRLVYGYYPDSRRAHVSVYDVATGRVMVNFACKPPNVNSMTFRPGQAIVVKIGNTGTEESEPTSIGMSFRNLRVELLR